MKVLGINSVYHELSAALVVDGLVIAAVEEERFNRQKHGKSANVDNPHILPIRSIEYCLKEGELLASDLDGICYSFDLQARKEGWREDRYSRPCSWGDAKGEEIFCSYLNDVPNVTSQALGVDITNRFHWVPHHLAHAASCYYPSGYDNAGILVVDGIGEAATGLLAAGEGSTISSMSTIEYPHSLGFLWEKISKFLGFSEYDACKVMGLAAYGNPRPMQRLFDEFCFISESTFSIDQEIVQFRRDGFDRLEGILGMSRKPQDPLEERHANIAATLQAKTDEILIKLARHLFNLFPSDYLCMAGGIALNCTTNWKVKEKSPFKEVFIPSAPHDAGTALGAALYVMNRPNISYSSAQAIPKLYSSEQCITKSQLITQDSRMSPVSVITKEAGAAYSESIQDGRIARSDNPYLGPHYEDEISEIILHSKYNYHRATDIALESARLLSAGNIIGWFQGRMEFGPRALGNRSLLADPRDPSMRERINYKIKRRELFRPFGPSVLEEFASDWFILGKPSKSLSYMLFACPVRTDKAHMIPAVVHKDGTSRLQMVSLNNNPLFHRLITSFYKITGIPLILNTSFNDSEPIVCTPYDAIETARKSGIDVLAIGNYLLYPNKI